MLAFFFTRGNMPQLLKKTFQTQNTYGFFSAKEHSVRYRTRVFTLILRNACCFFFFFFFFFRQKVLTFLVQEQSKKRPDFTIQNTVMFYNKCNK